MLSKAPRSGVLSLPTGPATGVPSPPRTPGFVQGEPSPGVTRRSGRLNRSLENDDRHEMAASQATRTGDHPAVPVAPSLAARKGLGRHVFFLVLAVALMTYFQGLVPGNFVDRVRFSRGLHACRVAFQPDIASLRKVLKSMAKEAHPDKVRGHKGVCSIEDINLLLDDAKPLDRLDYVSYAAGVLGLRSNTLGMLPMLGAVAVCWLLRVLLDLSARKLTQIRGGRASRLAKVFGTLFLAIPATAAAGSPSYGAIVARLEYSNFLYGAPPCATICGLVPSTCVDYGYFTDDIYTFWYDTQQRVCASVKTNVPRGAFHKLNQLGIMSFALSLTDGFQLTDLASLASGVYFYQKDCAKIAEAADVAKKITGLIAGHQAPGRQAHYHESAGEL